MQLTCSHCSARYLVDPAAIGPSGRMVQCFRCGHIWKADPPPRPAENEAPADARAPAPAAAPLEDRPVPDLVIRPQLPQATTTLPALAQERGLPVWLTATIGVLVILGAIGGAAYLFGGEFRALLADQTTPPLVVDQQSAQIDRQAGPGGATTIIVKGDILNTGRSDAAARRLYLTFKDSTGKAIAQREVDIATGRIPPNGRAPFEVRVEDAPTASTEVDLAAE